MADRVKELQKVTLSLFSRESSVAGEKAGEPVPFTFIYGVASDGFCPFEAALYQKKAGEKLTFSIPVGEAGEFFGYLLSQLRQTLDLQRLPDPLELEVAITRIEEAGHSEVVKSLSRALGGGCGGSCGCGCS